MALDRVNHLDFTTPDLEKTIEYLTQKLGFRLLRRTEHLGAAAELMSPAGDIMFEFHQLTEEYEIEFSATRPLFNHVAFEVVDCQEACKELKSKGVPFKIDLDLPHLRKESGRYVANTYDADDKRWIQLYEVERQ